MKASSRTTRSEKRERGEIDESQKKSRASSAEKGRPSKSRRTTTGTGDLAEDDPVSLARKALEMYNKEVEGDEDYVEPDALLGKVEVRLESRGPQSKEASISATNKHADSSLKSSTASMKTASKHTEKGTSSAWKKASQSTMFSDDPSIL
jgi:hypothetical protein